MTESISPELAVALIKWMWLVIVALAGIVYGMMKVYASKQVSRIEAVEEGQSEMQKTMAEEKALTELMHKVAKIEADKVSLQQHDYEFKLLMSRDADMTRDLQELKETVVRREEMTAQIDRVLSVMESGFQQTRDDIRYFNQRVDGIAASQGCANYKAVKD